MIQNGQSIAEVIMYALLNVLEDARQVQLVFVDKKSAENFRDFIHLYMIESGVENGYGAYWHFFDDPITYCDILTGKGIVDTKLVERMSQYICSARLAVRMTEASYYQPEIVSWSGAIQFNFRSELLPPRQKPEPGDLIRIVDHERFNNKIARVTNVDDKQVTLAPSDYGIKKEMTLPIGCVMKIHDFLKKK